MAASCPKCRADNPDAVKFCGDCGTPLAGSQNSFTKTLETTTPDELTRGTVFAGRYEIIEELGAGGMGRVYRAYDKKIEEEVALKLIRPEIAAEKRTVERFRNEIKTARKITHKNVCRTHDLGEEGKSLFITMEYVRGEDLKSVIRRMKVLAPGTAVSIAHQVAEGLGEAHRLGVVHRDLKPGNIMIDKDGNAKIMDFGIARSITGGGTTAEGVVIGTPEYMSPEQVEGKPADQRADIYALGVILFEMVTGRPPFEGETSLAIAHKHKYEPAPDPGELNPRLPVDLSRLILRCLEKEREKRFQTTAELLSGLEAVEAVLPTTERVPGRMPSRTKPKSSREITVKLTPRKLLLPAVALVAIAIAVLFIRSPWSREDGPPVFSSDRPSIAILNLANRTGQKDLDQYRDVLSSMISDDLSQSKYIYVVPSDQVNSILTRLGLIEAETFTTENLRDIGRRGVVRYLASGYYTKAGERFLVRLMVQEAESGKVIGTEEVQAKSVESFFDMADELALKIKPHLELTAVEVANDFDGALERVTTSSIEAYRHYIQGVRFGYSLKWREGIEVLEKAVAIDPEFAMAYRRLATYYSNLGNSAERRKNIDKALELSKRQGRLPIREKLLIEGTAATDPNAKIEAYSRLLELYPEDVSGNVQLGGVYLSLDESGKAAERYAVPVRNEVENALPYQNLSIVYCRLGEHEKAEKVLKDFIRDFPGHPGIAAMNRELAHLYMVQAKFKPALKALEESSRLGPHLAKEVARSRAKVLALMGDFDKAEAELQSLLAGKDDPDLLYVRQDLARLYKTRGRFQMAEDSFRQALAVATKNNLTFQVDELTTDLIDNHLATGDIDRAEATLSEFWTRLKEQGRDPGVYGPCLGLKVTILSKRKEFEEAGRFSAVYMSIVEKGANKRALSFPLRFQGSIELEGGELEKAIDLLTRAKSLLWFQRYLGGTPLPTREWHAFFIEPLALAYFRSGDLERARQEYEAITRLTTGRLAYGDIYAKSFYMLGQVYEQLGKKRPARANYRKFLELWKDADPSLPEIEDAKKRLSAL